MRDVKAASEVFQGEWGERHEEGLRASRGEVVLLPLVFAGSLLLFQAQPLMGKYILPWFGGSAGVWAVCMLFFQAVLLGGYAYAYGSTRWLSGRAQGIVHGVIVAGALVMLPIVPSERWMPSGSGNPTWRILGLLGATLGLPCFALSATAPLSQAWFAALNPGRSPYRLYALSNAASLLALLSYPFLVEPWLARSSQATAWSWGFGGYAILYGLCGATVLWRNVGSRSPSGSRAESKARPPGAGPSALWLLLAAAGSAMLLGTTNKITQDLAPAPLLWVLPLSLYLGTFIMCFNGPRWYSRVFWVLALFVASGSLLWIELAEVKSAPLNIGCYGGVMLACCMLCHGELAMLKPDPAYLTRYYLCIAMGGALGGAGVAVAAPLLLSGYYEFHAAGILCCGLMTVTRFARAPKLVRETAEPIALYGTISSLVVLGMLLVLEIANWPGDATKIARIRGFHGALTVSERNTEHASRHARLLRHGATTHGSQYREASLRGRPTGYYAQTAGPGCVFRALRPGEARRIGVVGLGTGAIAAYGKKGDVFRFYEIDEGVERLAKAYFTYLAESAAAVEVVLGDARMTMEREEPQRYDVLFVDAFSGDAIPTHLLTREAMAVYLRHTKRDGAIVFHVSNRYLNLAPVAVNLAEASGLHAVLLESYGWRDLVDEYPSDWVLVTRNRELLESQPLERAKKPMKGDPRVGIWTDDHTSLFQVMR